MDSLGLILVLIAIIGMTVQSGSCMLSRQRPLSVGFLNFVLCILTVFAAVFVCSGAMVIAPEFGSIMVQGEYATWFLRLALVATGALPAICSYRIRQLNKWQTPIWPRLLLGLLLGTLAAMQVQLLNAYDLPALYVHMYDVWWPPLAAWLTFCLAETMMALARIESRVSGYAFASALIAPLARFALVHQELFDPQSRTLWRILEPASLLLACLFLLQLSWFERIQDRKRRIAAIVLLALVALFAAFVFDAMPSGLKLGLDLTPAAFLLTGILLSIVWQTLPRQRTAEQSESRTDALMQSARDHFPIHRLSGIYFAVSILIIPLSLTDLFSIGALPRDLEIFILTFFWLSFSTRLAEGVFSTLPQLFKGGVLYLPAVNRAWKVIAAGLNNTRDSALAAARAAAAAVKDANKWLLAVAGVFATVLALAGLVVLGEALNYHKLVVEPFTWKGAGKDEDKLVAERVSDGVVNALGEMRSELLPVLLISTPTGAHATSTRVQAAVLDNGALQAAAAKSTDLTIAHVSIPLPMLMDPIERLVRTLFDIRVVSGSVHKSASGAYVLLIAADDGETWKVVQPPAAVKTEEAQKDDKKTSGDRSVDNKKGNDTKGSQAGGHETSADAGRIGQKSGAAAVAVAQPADDAPECVENATDIDPLDEMIDESAFHIANTDPSFTAMGLTRDWVAYRYFRRGLHRWKCYQAFAHWSDLLKAIESFRAAVHEDNSFAPAEYWLGIALQNAWQYDSAVQAFKDSAAANPQLIRAQMAESQTMASYNPATFPRPALANPPYNRPHTDDSRTLLAAVVSQPAAALNPVEQRAAYYGLCTDGFELDDSDHPYPNKFYLNYFFCSRAQALFFRLPLLSREGVEQKQLEASVLLMMGEVLNYHDYASKYPPLVSKDKEKAPLWLCSDASIDENSFREKGKETQGRLPGSKLTGHALRYYQASLDLTPGDSYVMCSAASAQAYLSDNIEPAMRRLQHSSTARAFLANALLARATQLSHGGRRNGALAEAYYRHVLDEYQAAVDLSPSDGDALDGYANAYWQWSLDARNGLMPNPPPPSEYSAWLAEFYAREAVRVFHLRGEKTGEDNARDTLGEVLITQGRNEEAAFHIRNALLDGYDAYGVDEFHWDLAQALACAANHAAGAEEQRKNMAEAIENIALIRKDEASQELQPYTITPGALDANLRRERCFPPPDALYATIGNLKLKSVTYQSQPGCGMLVTVEGVLDGARLSGSQIAEMTADTRTPPQQALYVWGEGVYGGDKTTRSVQLIPPSYDRRMYFAQFEDRTRHAVSPVVTFSVLKDEKNPACPHGRIILTFK